MLLASSAGGPHQKKTFKATTTSVATSEEPQPRAEEKCCFFIFAALGGNTLHRHGSAEVLFCGFHSKPSAAPTRSSPRPEGCGRWDWRSRTTSDFFPLKSGFNLLVAASEEMKGTFGASQVLEEGKCVVKFLGAEGRALGMRSHL